MRKLLIRKCKGHWNHWNFNLAHKICMLYWAMGSNWLALGR